MSNAETATHTPTPWKASKPEASSGWWYIDPMDSGFGDIATCWDALTSMGEANAAFIVRAANAHDALLEAAEAALGVLGAFAQTPPEFYQLSAAIAAARGEQ